MKKMKMFFSLMVVFALITGVAWTAPRKVTKVSYDSYLTVADLEKVSILKGVKLIAKIIASRM